MDKRDQISFRRARKLARWSYIGLLNPVLGWVLGCLSKSITNDILHQDTNEHNFRLLRGVRRNANIGITVSVIALAAWTFSGITYTNMVVEEQKDQAAYDQVANTVAVNEANKRTEAAIEAARSLEANYNTLVDQYNQLVTYAQYLGNNAYQTRQRVTCNTYSYTANSSTISCY